MKTNDLKVALQKAADRIIEELVTFEQQLVDAKGTQSLALMQRQDTKREVAHQCFITLIPLQALVGIPFMRAELDRFNAKIEWRSAP